MRHSALGFTFALIGEISLRERNALTACLGMRTFFWLTEWFHACS